MGYRVAALLLAAAVLACAQRREGERPARYASRGLRGAVAAGSEPAAEAGMRLLQAGGNAVDAGVAATLAAAVVEFSHFGFGGEAPILVRTRHGAVHALAGVGTMPQAATAEFFRKRKPQPGEVLQPLERNGLVDFVPPAGLMPALVPGMVESVLVALREFGTRRFADVVAPAIELADGWPIDETRASAIGRARRFFEYWPTSQRVFMPGGRLPQPGEVFRQPDLARTLRAMVAAERGTRTEGIDAVRDYFYRGEVARRIASFARASGGLLAYEDLAAFRIAPEEPLSTAYRGYQVYKGGFWTQGPAFLEALNLLEGFDLAAMGHNSADYLHTLVESLKLAYADRDTYYGDPKFARVPAGALLSKEYAAERRRLIGEWASLDFRPGRIPGASARHPSESDGPKVEIDVALAARDTTCVNAMDRDGVVFSATPSGAWLPSVIAGDTGIPLTTRGQSFLLIAGHANELAGGKRPRITLSPTIVTRDGQPFLALSTPGGDNQEQSLLQLFLNVVEFGMNAQAAVEAPRVQTRHLVSSFDNHAMHPGDLLLDERIPAAVVEALGVRRHRVGTRTRYASGAAPTILRVTPQGVMEAGADPYGYRVARAW